MRYRTEQYKKLKCQILRLLADKKGLMQKYVVLQAQSGGLIFPQLSVALHILGSLFKGVIKR